MRRFLSFLALMFFGTSLVSIAASPLKGQEYYPDIGYFAGRCFDPDVWVRTEGLMWWTNGTDYPPLVTTSPDDTPINQAGRLGYDTTSILVGNGNHLGQMRGGFRMTAGVWRDKCHRLGLEADYWSLSGDSATTSYEGNGSPILARPFYDMQNQRQGAELTSFPGVAGGRVRVEGDDYVQSVGTWLRCNLITQCCSYACDPCCDPCDDYCRPAPSRKIRMERVDFLFGYRNYRLNDRLSVYEYVEDAELPSSVDIQDHFRALNDFHGGELGFDARLRRCKWTLDLLAAMAIGNNRRVTTINGQQVITIGELEPVVYPAGILALGTNSGHRKSDVVCVIPRFGARLGYDFTECVSAFVSYDLVYWGDVFRAADQIDARIDPRNIPPSTGGTGYPAFLGRGSHFWAQGISLGAEVRF